jgi:catalase-peroxidase
VSNYDVNESSAETSEPTSTAKCPMGTAGGASAEMGTTNNDWWPNQISVDPLLKGNPKSDPYEEGFDYVELFNSLNLDSVKADIVTAMKTSQDWWPADYGHYGPFFIRMAWHAAGTYRVSDGRGGGGEGLQRFAPLNSWPDNVNLDKARRLLWPVKKKYGRKLSWADLMILAGNVALEDMGFPTFGFAGGRADVWEPDNTYWGNETEWLANKRYDESRDAETLEDPLAAVQMGLIYVNPEGPDGNPDFKAAAADIRTTFARMAMNDEETVALIAGGHAFGKTHGAGDAAQVGPEPEANEKLESVGLGWENSQGAGHGGDTISSGLEVTWTPHPTRWDNDYLRLIYKYEWEMEESPAGAKQWRPINIEPGDMAPHAHGGDDVVPKMLTTDLALRFGDEEYDRICQKFLADFDYFTDVFARAWFKLTHRDMGPRARYHGPEVPEEELLWQDPVPEGRFPNVVDKHQARIALDQSDISITDLVRLAWASASTYRNTDKRGGANGARIDLEPQRSWPVNADVIPTLEKLKELKDSHQLNLSLADLIVFAGTYAVEEAASGGGVPIVSYFLGGRGDAYQTETDVESFNHLYPVADAFINWSHKKYADSLDRMLIDKATLLGLTPPEMTALYGGLRALGVSTNDHGVLTDRKGVLSNDFFVNILDMDIQWSPVLDNLYQGRDRKTQEVKWIASRADLVFASNSILRAYAEVYASDDGQEQLVIDFIAAWEKVMNNDRFDVQ